MSICKHLSPTQCLKNKDKCSLFKEFSRNKGIQFGGNLTVLDVSQEWECISNYNKKEELKSLEIILVVNAYLSDNYEKVFGNTPFYQAWSNTSILQIVGNIEIEKSKIGQNQIGKTISFHLSRFYAFPKNNSNNSSQVPAKTLMNNEELKFFDKIGCAILCYVINDNRELFLDEMVITLEADGGVAVKDPNTGEIISNAGKENDKLVQNYERYGFVRDDPNSLGKMNVSMTGRVVDILSNCEKMGCSRRLLPYINKELSYDYSSSECETELQSIGKQ